VYKADCGCLFGESSIILKRLPIPTPGAYSLFEAFAAGICLLTGRDAFMRTICAKGGGGVAETAFSRVEQTPACV
jgi:hypothetical protein